MKLSVTKIFEFEAAHFLPGYDGACSKMHGHSYKLEVEVAEEITDEDCPSTLPEAMVMDFSHIKKIVQNKVIQYLDHSLLNKVTERGFPKKMPTAENMVVWIFFILKEILLGVKLYRVRLWETSTSYAELCGD